MPKDTRRHASDGAQRARRSTARPSLVRLGHHHEYTVAEGDPDIRGWAVRSADGRKLGRVADLIVDTAGMRVRYVEVRGDKNLLGVGAGDRYFLIPIGAARLDEAGDVVINRLPAAGLTAAWLYDRGRLTDRRESTLLAAYDADVTDAARATAVGLQDHIVRRPSALRRAAGRRRRDA